MKQERSFSEAIRQVKTSAVRDILKLTQNPDVLSFAGGLPAEDTFPVEALRVAYERVFARGRGVLQYGVTEGVLTLREWLVSFLAGKRIETSTDRVLLTTGSQQGIRAPSIRWRCSSSSPIGIGGGISAASPRCIASGWRR
jgi:2-aminoadipate transaminase